MSGGATCDLCGGAGDIELAADSLRVFRLPHTGADEDSDAL
jgi:hypothetical protein